MIARRRAQSRSLTNLSMDSTNSGSTVGGGYETIAPLVKASSATTNTTTAAVAAAASAAAAAAAATTSTSSVYLNKSSSPRTQQRHVTVIPINSKKKKQQQEKQAAEAKAAGEKQKLAKANSAAASPSKKENDGSAAAAAASASYYDAIFDISRRNRSPTRRQRPLSEVNEGWSAVAAAAARPTAAAGRISRREDALARSPPKVASSGGVMRHLSDSRKGHHHHHLQPHQDKGYDIQQRVRKRSQRSSSLGPLLDEHRINSQGGGGRAVTNLKSSAANTNSLESLDSNPRQAPAKADLRLRHNNRVLARPGLVAGAVPRRPLLLPSLQASSSAAAERERGERESSSQQPLPHPLSLHHHRPPPAGQSGFLHPLHHHHHPPPNPPPPPTGFPPHIPLPGLTCQLSFPLGEHALCFSGLDFVRGVATFWTVVRNMPWRSGRQSFLTCNYSPLPGMPSVIPAAAGSSGSLDQSPQQQQQQHQRSLREQQVVRLRQEMAHPAGVRLTLRRRDCHNSLALVELFGCLWVAGWKQREYPVLYNAFHIGDQVRSVYDVFLNLVNSFIVRTPLY